MTTSVSVAELSLHSHSESENWIKDVKMTEILFVRHAESFNNVLYEFIRKKYGKDVSPSYIEEKERSLRQTDATLSEKGYKQIELLKSYTASGCLAKEVNSSPDMSDWIIISSPMLRCLLTSQAIAQGLGNRTVYVHPELYESGGCHGLKLNPTGKNEILALPGSTKEEIESQFPNHKCLPGMEQGWYHGKLKEENQKEFQLRSKRLVQWLWTLHNTLPENRSAFLNRPEVGSFKNIIIVNHGNLLNGIITGLQTGSGLVTHNNTGYSHIQLTTGRYNKEYAIVKFLNKTNHLLSIKTTKKSVSANDTTFSNSNNATASASTKSTKGATQNIIESTTNLNIAAEDNNNDNMNTDTNSVEDTIVSCSNNNEDAAANDDELDNIITGNDSIQDGWIQEFQPSS